MTALIGETLLYEAKRGLEVDGSLTYYQYKAVVSLLEIIALHDNVIVVQTTKDASFKGQIVDYCNMLMEKFRINIQLKSIDDLLGDYASVFFKELDELIGKIYGRPLGVNSNDICSDTKKDRYAEDVADYIQHVFLDSARVGDIKSCKLVVGEYFSKNVSTAEVHYFLRGHAHSLIAEQEAYTCFHTGVRLIGDIWYASLRRDKAKRTVGYDIYTHASYQLKQRRQTEGPRDPYPYIPLIMWVVLYRANSKQEVFSVLADVRSALVQFRKKYSQLEDVINDGEESIKLNAEAKNEIQENIENIWLPAAKALSPAHLADNTFLKNAERLCSKILGRAVDIKLNLDDDEDPDIKVSSSLTDVIIASINQGKDAKRRESLLSGNEVMLGLLDECCQQQGIPAKAREIFPVRDFSYQIFREVDKALNKL